MIEENDNLILEPRFPQKSGGFTVFKKSAINRKAATGIMLMAALGVFYLAAIASVALYASPCRADLAVVLGNEILDDGTPSPRLQARLNAALALYQEGLARRVMVSGGVERHGGWDEAAVMAAYLAAHGMPPDVIVQDPNGIDMLATSRNTACLLGREGGSVVAVTQWFHAPRADGHAPRRFVQCLGRMAALCGVARSLLVPARSVGHSGLCPQTGQRMP